MRWRHLLTAGLLVGVVATSAWAADGWRPKQWNLDRIGAPVAGATGGGVVIAVIDSGVDLDHPDLAGQLVQGRDFVDGDDEPDDSFGHGTHVAGIAAGVVGGGDVVGVAPGARIMPVRVLNDSGKGSSEDVAAAVRWAVANGAKVINLSLGEDTQAVLGSSLAEVVREAWAAGVVPVIAAGNKYVTGSGFSDEPALVVSATTRHDGKPTYSSGVGSARWGIAAPGGENPNLGVEDAVVSSYAEGGYAWAAGTSQSAPHVSAAIAILLSLGLTPQEAVDRVLATAVDIGPRGRDATFGAGRLDLTRAVDGLVRSGPPPTAAPDAGDDRPASTASSPPPPRSTPTQPGAAAPPPETATPDGAVAPELPDGTDVPPATTDDLDFEPVPVPADEVAAGAGGADDGDDEVPPLASVLAALAAAAAGIGTAREWVAQRGRRA